MTTALRPAPIRYLGWLLFGLFLVLAVTAMVLGHVNNSRFQADGPPTLDLYLNLVALSIMSAVGGLLIYRHPRHPIGWLFCGITLLHVLDHFVWGYVYYGAVTRPGSLPGANALMLWQHWHGVAISILPLALLFSWFPTGRPLSARWAALNWLNAAMLLAYLAAATLSPLTVLNRNLPYFIDGASPVVPISSAWRAALEPLTWAAYLGQVLLLFASVAALLVRLSRATGVERQQIKWFVFAASLIVPGLGLLVYGLLLESTRDGPIYSAGIWLLVCTVSGIAVASAIAILRYRLYDIDLIIRRTLIYSALTALLAVAYLGSVLVLQTAFQALTGEGRSELVTVLSTLGIAALFLPLRRRVQTAMDRRFYRRKYDAARTLARFGGSVRDDVNLADLQARLLTVVDETMQPAHASLWVRPAAESDRAA